jgi:hypothetical protein
MKRIKLRKPAEKYKDIPTRVVTGSGTKRKNDPGPQAVRTIKREGDVETPRLVPVKVMESFYSSLPPKEISYFQEAENNNYANMLLGGVGSVTNFISLTANDGEILDLGSIVARGYTTDAAGIRHLAPQGLLSLAGYFQMRVNNSPINMRFIDGFGVGLDSQGSWSTLNVDLFTEQAWGSIPMHLIIPEGLTFTIVFTSTFVNVHGLVSWPIQVIVRGRKLPKVVWDKKK